MNKNYDKTIFELSAAGKRAYRLPPADGASASAQEMIPQEFLRSEDVALPGVSEPEVVRHYTRLSQKNYGLDAGFYPLGSCTMKYNPKVNEDVAGLPGFANLHPAQPESTVQGALQLLYELQQMLSEVAGMARFSLQPAAGAHGELAGLMIIKAWHESRGDAKRKKIIVPDSSHGTNPASAAEAGFEIVKIDSAADGTVDMDALAAALDDETAGLMLTNPNTLGLFEKNISEVSRLVHEAGGLLYYDGANLNAIMGYTRPGDMGFDVIHINTHKTFATPHGGGGPGAGPIGVREHLIDFLPSPVVAKTPDGYALDRGGDNSIGKLRGWYGSFGVLVKAWCYISSMGAEGLKEATELAVLNANYMKEKLKAQYELPYDAICKHEFVLNGLKTAAEGVHTLDVAKRIIDMGFHPPTIYFPLIVANALMIEPTETESKETLDSFIEALNRIAQEAVESPELLTDAPHHTPVRRVDEVAAARNPIITWRGTEENE
ncbi:MAG: aminomethyl-transferring glycine dehydrogenase subunit GcvPB [Clostridiales Family XIII bacterium]|nr:aminomethyl-transferring glycine dehydrogenase subunit GcvPB [Clostridiales Family XIII bacterium]